MSGKTREKIIFFLSTFLIVLFDFLSKRLILNRLYFGESIPLIQGVFHISLVANRGSAFGLFKNLSSFFTVFSIIAVLVVGYLFLTSRQTSKIYHLSLSLILGGALGNLIDRISLGFVVDFLDFRIWPVFNLADSAITIGVGLLILQLLHKKK
ncbi:MAG: signal peptidase II [Candidatus Omnitrophota bacterium]